MENVLIAREIDGLPLCSSLETVVASVSFFSPAQHQFSMSKSSEADLIEESEEAETRRQAKWLAKRFAHSKQALSAMAAVETKDRNHFFYYLADSGCLFIVCCSAAYPKVLALSFLDELRDCFLKRHTLENVQNSRRPFSLIRFETEIGRLLRKYSNQRAVLGKLDKSSGLSTRVQTCPQYSFDQIVPGYHYKLSQSYGNFTRLRSATPREDLPTFERVRYFWQYERYPLVIVPCWIYICFWNLFYDVWYSNVDKKFSSSVILPQYASLEAGGAPIHNGFDLEDLTVFANAYGIFGIWILIQLIRYLIALLTPTPKVEKVTSKTIWDIFCPAPLFRNKGMLTVHAFSTVAFLWLCALVQFQTGISYFETRLAQSPMAREPSYWRAFLSWETFPYTIYSVVCVFCVLFPSKEAAVVHSSKLL